MYFFSSSAAVGVRAGAAVLVVLGAVFLVVVFFVVVFLELDSLVLLVDFIKTENYTYIVWPIMMIALGFWGATLLSKRIKKE